MPADPMHKHLSRLDRVWLEWPVYFVTTCTFHRRKILASRPIATVLIDEWKAARQRHGWAIGRYVIMPDHVHFFCAADPNAVMLEKFLQRWKEWTSKLTGRGSGIQPPVWQEEFFDHVLRSDESYSQKWEYGRQNPVRAGFVRNADDWPWQGEIEPL